MGRPPKPFAEKRAMATFRLTGAARDKIEKAAAESGRSIASELEARVLATIDLDSIGIKLIEQIASGLQVAAKVTGEPNWHSTLMSWGAGREMLYRGPIESFRPYTIGEDPELAEAMRHNFKLRDERREVVAELSSYGIALPEDPLGTAMTKRAGLFGGGLALNSREIWRTKVAALDESPERDRALELIDRLVRLDVEIDDAWTECKNQIQGFRKDEDEGRDAYRRHLQETARRQKDAGEDFSTSDLFALWYR